MRLPGPGLRDVCASRQVGRAVMHEHGLLA